MLARNPFRHKDFKQSTWESSLDLSFQVSVATSVDAPIKLLFPRPLDADSKKAPFSMLGLGDIVIPGIFVALILRYDAKQKFASTYFRRQVVDYDL